MKNCIFIFIFLTGAACSLHAQTKIDWKKDIEFLKSELPDKHVDLFSSVSKKEFTSNLDNIISQADELTDAEVAIHLQQAIARMGDSHTSINYFTALDSSMMLPLRCYWFSDGIYVMHTSPGNEELLGKRLISINRFKIKVIIDSLATLIVAENSAIIKRHTPWLLTFSQLLQFFRFARNDNFVIEVESPGGAVLRKEIKTMKFNNDNRISFKPDSVTFFAENQKLLFTDKYFEDDSIYYVQYNKCWGREMEEKFRDKEKAKEMPSFTEFRKKIISAIDSLPLNKMIVDMRLNPGGSSSQGSDLVTELLLKKKINKKGKLFVVIGRTTFSSAIVNAIEFKSKTKAILVGEETGGNPNHFGEIKSFSLPSSGIKVYYSTKQFRLTGEDSRTMKPDVIIEESFSDYRSGIDPVYTWIVNYR